LRGEVRVGRPVWIHAGRKTPGLQPPEGGKDWELQGASGSKVKTLMKREKVALGFPRIKISEGALPSHPYLGRGGGKTD